MKFRKKAICLLLVLTLTAALAPFIGMKAGAAIYRRAVYVSDLAVGDIIVHGYRVINDTDHSVGMGMVFENGNQQWETIVSINESDDINKYSFAPSDHAELIEADGNNYKFKVYPAKVTDIALDRGEYFTMACGDAVPFTAIFTPENALDKTLSWSSSGCVKLYTDESCSTEIDSSVVDMQTVYAKADEAGSADVTVIAHEKYVADVCHITVIAKQEVTAPTAADLSYDGEEHELLASPAVVVTGNTAAGSVTYALEGSSVWTSDFPKGRDAGDYVVLYKAAGNDEYAEYNGRITVTVRPVSAEVPTGLTAVYGNTLASVSLPEGWTWADETASVGNVGDNEFAANYHNINDDPNYADIQDRPLSVRVTPAPSGITSVPTAAKGLEYDSKEHALVSAGTASGGTMKYAVTTDPDADPAALTFSATIPAKTEAGTYYVWYKAAGDANHTDTSPVKLTVSVADISFYVSDGSKQTYKKADLSFTFRKKGDDNNAYEYLKNFKKVSIKGRGIDRALTEGEYTAENGSLKLTLKNSLLKELKPGTYTVTVFFIDETAAHSASATFTVPKASGGSTPGTGDDTSGAIVFAWILFLLSLSVTAYGTYSRIRSCAVPSAESGEQTEGQDIETADSELR